VALDTVKLTIPISISCPWDNPRGMIVDVDIPRVHSDDAPEVAFLNKDDGIRERSYRSFSGGLWTEMRSPTGESKVDEWAKLTQDEDGERWFIDRGWRAFTDFVTRKVLYPGSSRRLFHRRNYGEIAPLIEVDGMLPLDKRLIVVDDQIWEKSHGPQLVFAEKGDAVVKPFRPRFMGWMYGNAASLPALHREVVEEALHCIGRKSPGNTAWPEVVESSLVPSTGLLGESMSWLLDHAHRSRTRRLCSYGAEEIDLFVTVREVLQEQWPGVQFEDMLHKDTMAARIRGVSSYDEGRLASVMDMMKRVYDGKNFFIAQTAHTLVEVASGLSLEPTLELSGIRI